MNKDVFFQKRLDINPKIYAYSDTNPQYDGLLKIGYTQKNVIARVKEQYPIIKPGELPYKILLEISALKNDGSSFTDKDVHKVLIKNGFENTGGEWFKCSVNDVQNAILSIKEGKELDLKRTNNFKMRPEQQDAVKKTADYFKNCIDENPNKAPHFLWNAKMRFGKTFATYQLAKTMGWKKLLILTFKPAVQNAWEEDLLTHIDFEGWQFFSKDNVTSLSNADKTKPIICFGSFQDFLGRNSIGGIKAKNEEVHAINWDCVVLDEYHYGAWRENAKDLFEAETDDDAKKNMDNFDEDIMRITTSAYLYLSGTPFRAIATGEFIEEQIYNWTYTDEQKAKAEWRNANTNPYLALPQMVMMTYQLPDSIRNIALQGEFNEFDLNLFFAADTVNGVAKFKYENEVQKWLDLIRGNLAETSLDNLKLGASKPAFPFSDTRILENLLHTFWFLPSVASCYAMEGLIKKPNNKFYHDYQIIVAAGNNAGIGVEALKYVQNNMGNPLEKKSITLSCGKLTTGVSVKAWSGIFMLRSTSSPETYFQAAFRIQTPWTIKNPDKLTPNKEAIIKKNCYLFDFAPNRALRQIADYSCRLNIEEDSSEKKVADFIKFLPVLAYDGSSMKKIDAAGVLDIAMSGTTATLLARRWESALLVNIDNDTLKKIIANDDAMKALQSIEGFRSLNKDIDVIINKSEAVNKIKKEVDDKELSKSEKKQLTEDEKEFKSKRKEIQEKLIKFATRIPVFMYLTDFREETLKQVISVLEPDLFKKVTGLEKKDFALLVSLGLFNSALMNDAVYKFKRYEDASLAYAGVNKHINEHKIGLYDTLLNKSEIY